MILFGDSMFASIHSGKIDGEMLHLVPKSDPLGSCSK